MTTQRKRIKVTYANLSSPDPLLHDYYEEDVTRAKADFGATHGNHINGEWVLRGTTFQKHSPVDLDLHVGTFHEASSDDVDAAVKAARAAYPAWRDTPYQERIAMLGKVAGLISERLFYIGAVLSLENGKNRLESIGEVEEAADLIRYCMEAMQAHNGFVQKMNAVADNVSNQSVLKPYGVWAVISPFNYPAALSAGPAGAALIAGNTVVHKPAAETPLTTTLIAQCFVDAGLPAGVYNMVGGGDDPGKALVAHPDVDGLTFTGSYEVGQRIMRDFSLARGYVRPVILEMGGKNPTIITDNADVEKAALGVMRSAFGFSGQKCSACSRVYVHEALAEDFKARLVELTEGITVGDPTVRETYIGPVIDKAAYERFQENVASAREHGDVLTGGQVAEVGNGDYVTPTIVADLPDDHPIWSTELFVPILALRTFTDNEEAMRLANGVPFGLTAGFFSEDADEVQWFLNNIESGCVYVNRPNGATTGAWPGYQAFGGWKGSTGTNKAAGSHYYLQQYLREQSHTVVR